MIKTVHIEPHTPEWHKFRENGIGGSEVGTVCGMNKYGSRIKLFYEKIGAVKPNNEPREILLHGNFMEEYIESWWKYFENNIEQTMVNKLSDNVVRKCRKVNGYIVNDKYPWLFASPDRMIVKGQPRLVEDERGDVRFGEALSKGGIVEMKTVNGFVAREYVEFGSIPPYQIMQVQDYMTILEIDYAEYAILEDGRKFYVVPMEYNKALSDKVIEDTYDFWYNHVTPAKELYREYARLYMSGKKSEAEKTLERIHHYEPEPDSSDLTREFIASRYHQKIETVSGDVSLLNRSIEYKRLSRLIKKLEERKDTVYNGLMNFCVQNGCYQVELPGGGYYKMVRKGKNASHQLTFGKINHDSITKADQLAETL